MLFWLVDSVTEMSSRARQIQVIVLSRHILPQKQITSLEKALVRRSRVSPGVLGFGQASYRAIPYSLTYLLLTRALFQMHLRQSNAYLY